MKVALRDIFHLELFRIEDEEFIKDVHHPGKGNARRRSGKKNYVFISLDTLVQRKKPDTASTY